MSGPLMASSYGWPSPVPSGCSRSVCERLKFSISRAPVDESAPARCTVRRGLITVLAAATGLNAGASDCQPAATYATASGTANSAPRASARLPAFQRAKFQISAADAVSPTQAMRRLLSQIAARIGGRKSNDRSDAAFGRSSQRAARSATARQSSSVSECERMTGESIPRGSATKKWNQRPTADLTNAAATISCESRRKPDSPSSACAASQISPGIHASWRTCQYAASALPPRTAPAAASRTTVAKKAAAAERNGPAKRARPADKAARTSSTKPATSIPENGNAEIPNVPLQLLHNTWPSA